MRNETLLKAAPQSALIADFAVADFVVIRPNSRKGVSLLWLTPPC